MKLILKWTFEEILNEMKSFMALHDKPEPKVEPKKEVQITTKVEEVKKDIPFEPHKWKVYAWWKPIDVYLWDYENWFHLWKRFVSLTAVAHFFNKPEAWYINKFVDSNKLYQKIYLIKRHKDANKTYIRWTKSDSNASQ